MPEFQQNSPLRSVWLAAVFLMASTATLPADSHEAADILIIHSYHPSFEWTLAQHEGLITALDEWGQAVKLSVEYMDTKRLSSPEHIEGLVTLYEVKYGGSPPDVVISTDNSAFSMLYEQREKIFGSSVPLVFCGVNFFEPEMWPDLVNAVGVDERPDFDETIRFIDQLQRSPPDVAVITDRSVTGREYRRGFEKWLAEQDDQSRYIIIDEGFPDDIIRTVSSLADDTVLLYLTYAQAPDGRAYQPVDLLRLLAGQFDGPIFGNYRFMVNQGILGGPIISGFDQGADAARLAIGIVDGRIDPGTFLLESSSDTEILDHRILKQNRIRNFRIPDDWTVINRPQLPWQRYPLESGLVLALLMILSLSLAMAIQNNRQRAVLLKEIEVLNTDLEDRVRRRSMELSRAESELMRNEKLAALGSLVAGVAHEVNTPLGLGITGASYLRDRFQDLRSSWGSEGFPDSELEEFLNTGMELSELIESNLLRAGNQIRNFKQVAVDQTGEMPRCFDMADNLQEFVLSMKNKLKGTGITIAVHCPPNLIVTHFPGDLWRILANLVINSLKHGFEKNEAGEISITVKRQEEEAIEFVYRDTGKGISEENLGKVFTPYFTTARDEGGSGLGLHLVRSIVEDRHGGSITVRNRRSRGVRFTVTLPVNSPALNSSQSEILPSSSQRSRQD